jgi:hypothetical protein
LNKILQLLIPAQAFDFEASVPRAQQPAMPVVGFLTQNSQSARTHPSVRAIVDQVIE